MSHSSTRSLADEAASELTAVRDFGVNPFRALGAIRDDLRMRAYAQSPSGVWLPVPLCAATVPAAQPPPVSAVSYMGPPEGRRVSPRGNFIAEEPEPVCPICCRQAIEGTTFYGEPLNAICVAGEICDGCKPPHEMECACDGCLRLDEDASRAASLPTGASHYPPTFPPRALEIGEQP